MTKMICLNEEVFNETMCVLHSTARVLADLDEYGDRTDREEILESRVDKLCDKLNEIYQRTTE